MLAKSPLSGPGRGPPSCNTWATTDLASYCNFSLNIGALLKSAVAEDFPGGAAGKHLPANIRAQARSLNQGDSACQGATKTMCHGY